MDSRFVIRRVDISSPIGEEMIYTLVSEVFKPNNFVGDRLPRYKTGYWWIAYLGDEPAAFAGLRPSIRWEGTGYLCLAGVLQRFRGRGLQRRLIRKRLEQCVRNGWHTAITDTMHDNAASMRSLIDCGFRPYTPHVKWGSPDQAVYWRRPLWSRKPRRSRRNP